MKRKVIQIANSTQLISLPRKWSLQFGIKKGDELEVEEKGNKLEISTEKSQQLNEISLDVSELDRTSTMFYIRSAYRKGFDTIKINFNKQTTDHIRKKEEVSYISVINTEVNRLVGLEVVKQTENYCELKDFSGDHTGEFDSLMRKIFLQIKDATNDMLKAAETKDIQLLRTIEEKHDSITKFVSYCIRLLNKKNQFDLNKSHVIFHVVANLDLITDIIKYCSRNIIKYNKKFSKESLKIGELVRDAIDNYYELFYKFDIKKLRQNIKLRDDIINLGDAMISKIGSSSKRIPPTEILIINDLKMISDILRDLCEVRTEIELKDIKG